MVAGGGGGSSWTTAGGASGGLSGYATNNRTIGGSQNEGYKFGIGQDGYGVGDSDGVAGGGGGYYGGTTSGAVSGRETGAGGSSFISGHEGCDAIDEASTEDNIIHTSQSIHYSNKKFENTIMIDGLGYDWKNSKGYLVGAPEKEETNGYVKITAIRLDPLENEYFETLELAIAACKENAEKETKIIMLKDVEENNIVSDGKNIILNLSKHTISSTINKPVLEVNNAKLSIIGEGNITNTYKYEFVEETQDHDKIDGGIGIYLTENAELTLGEDDRAVNRDIKIFGYGAGIYKDKQTESILNFYDGEVSGIKSIIGSVDKTAKNCNVITDLDEETNILTTYLGIVEDPVARIGNVYYGTLEKALEDVPETEEYEMKTIDTRLIPENFVGDDTYFFYKEGDKLVPNNSGINSTTAHSYMKIDLSESLPEEYKLTIDASVSSESSDRGIVMITNSSDTPAIDSNKALIYTNGTNAKIIKDYNMLGGKAYYIHIFYKKDQSIHQQDDKFYINSIKINEKETLEVVKEDTIKYIEPATTIVMLPSSDTPEIPRNIKITNSQEVKFTKNVILDLNGQTTTVPVLANKGKLDIIDSSREKTGTLYSQGECTIVNNANLSVSSGTVKMSAEGKNAKYLYTIKNTNKFELKGGIISSTENYSGCIYNYDFGETVITDGKVNCTVDRQSHAIHNMDNAKLQINGGYIINTGSSSFYSYGIYNTNNAELIMSGGNIETVDDSILNYSTKDAIIKKGIITTTSGTNIVNGKNCNFRILDGEFNSQYTSISNDGILYFERGTIKAGTALSGGSNSNSYINGGKIQATSTGISSYGYVEINRGLIEYIGRLSKNEGISAKNIEINGGTIKDFDRAVSTSQMVDETNRVNINDIEIINCNYGVYFESRVAGRGIVNIGTKDGNLENKPIINGNLYGVYNYQNGKVYFYDGILKGANLTYGEITEIEEGTEIKITYENGIYSEELVFPIEAIAKNLETHKKYLILQEAIDEAEEGQTIQILRNANLSETVNIELNKNIILDLNGYTIKAYKTFINNNGILKIKNDNLNSEGKIEVLGNGINNYGDLELGNITIKSMGRENTLIYTTKSLKLNDTNITIINSNKTKRNIQ